MTESTKRLDYVQRSLDIVWDYYERPEYRERINTMRALGHRTEVLDAVLHPDTYLPLGLADSSELAIDTTDIASSVAVVALCYGETISASTTSHVLQDTDVTAIDKKHCITPPVGGTVAFAERVCNVNSGYIFSRGRPTLILHYNADRKNEYPGVLIHEFTHIAQILSDTVHSYPELNSSARHAQKYTDELEAYDIQATTFEYDMGQLDDQTMPLAFSAQAFRQYKMPPGKKVVDEHSLAQLIAHPELARIARQTLIEPRS